MRTRENLSCRERIFINSKWTLLFERSWKTYAKIWNCCLLQSHYRSLDRNGPMATLPALDATIGRTSGLRDIHLDAYLTLNLLDRLDKLQYPWEHTWSKERITQQDIAGVCQVAEAIHKLPLASLPERLIRPALDWLVTLSVPLRSRARPLQDESLRLFPNRLKTLAVLNAFAREPHIRSDFVALSNKFSPTECKIKLEPNPNDSKMDLVTLIWLDTLLHLAKSNIEIFEWQHEMTASLDSLEHSLEHLANSAAPNGDFALEKLRDKSYAFDILIRAERLTVDSALFMQIVENLIGSLRQHRPGRPYAPGELYAALQLASHAPQHVFAADTVRLLLRELRETNVPSLREPMAYDALLLRLLATVHGTQLNRTLEEVLWERMRDASDNEERAQANRRNEDLIRVLQTHFYIQLGRPEILSEGHATRVYRLPFRSQFGVRFSSEPRSNEMPMNVIVKESPLPALLHAADAYESLPASLKPLFAMHGHPESFDGNPRGKWYLMMHDLEGYYTLRQELDALESDGRRLFLRQQMQLAAIVQNVARGLNALHRESKPHHPDIHAVDNLYLVPLNRHLGELSRRSFAGLRRLMYADFNANDILYNRLGKYLSGLRRHEKKLRPPQLGLVHGDCHSRNIMLNEAGNLKFIDLENLEPEEDYLLDYALLLEDVAMYRFISSEEISLTFQDPNGKTDTGKIVPQIRYTRFTPSAMALSFQENLLRELEQFALSIGDSEWRPRLWLAIARALTLLSVRRFLETPMTMQANEQDNIVAMLYAESIRLLDELLMYFDGQADLSYVPFPGTTHKPTPAVANAYA